MSRITASPRIPAAENSVHFPPWKNQLRPYRETPSPSIATAGDPLWRCGSDTRTLPAGVTPGNSLVYPGGSRIELVMHTLPGHARDAEAFFVVAVPEGDGVDFAEAFGCGESYPLAAFFERHAGIAPRSDEVILPYTVDANE